MEYIYIFYVFPKNNTVLRWKQAAAHIRSNTWVLVWRSFFVVVVLSCSFFFSTVLRFVCYLLSFLQQSSHHLLQSSIFFVEQHFRCHGMRDKWFTIKRREIACYGIKQHAKYQYDNFTRNYLMTYYSIL